MSDDYDPNRVFYHDLNPTSTELFDNLVPGLFLEPGNANASVEVLSLKYGSTDLKGANDAVHPRGCRPRDPRLQDENKARGLKESPSRLAGSGLSAQATSNLVRVWKTEELRQYMAVRNCVQFFFIHQRNSYSPLTITHELFETLLCEKHVPPIFKDYVLYMGERVREVEIALPSLRRFPTGLPRSDGDDHALECMYGLRFVDLNGRGSLHQPTSRWSLRQTAIYSRHRSSRDEGTWIFVTPSRLAKHRLTELAHNQGSNSPSSPFTIHLLLLETAIANWRPYLVDLATETDQHAERLLGVSRHDEGPFTMAECGERQELMLLEEKLVNAALIIKATINTVQQLLSIYSSIRESKPNQQAIYDDPIAVVLSNQLQELDLNSIRVEAQRARVQSITNSVSSFLDLDSGFALQNIAKESKMENEEMRQLSQRMHDLTKKSTQDAAAVKVLTILTLIYLPVTVVSNFFSTSFVNSETSSGGGSYIVVSNEWWILVASAVPLTLLTLYIWYVWMRIQAYGKYPWWWKRRRNAIRGDLAHCSEEKV